jgi:hypothetical protein
MNARISSSPSLSSSSTVVGLALADREELPPVEREGDDSRVGTESFEVIVLPAGGA